MTSVVNALAELLQEYRNPQAITRWLWKHRPSTCHDDLLHVMDVWRRTYGDAAVKGSTAYKTEMGKVIERTEQMVRGAASRDERLWAARVRERAIGFDEMSFSSQHSLQVSGQLAQTAARSYSGSATVDRMLAALVQVPEYATLKAPQAHVVVAVPAQPAMAGGGAGGGIDKLNAKARSLISDMLATVTYPRPKAFELACALAFMCGRSLAELMATGLFSAAKGDHAPHPCVLFQTSSSSSAEVIRLLCASHRFLAGLQRLRDLKQVASAASHKSINSRFCKSANTAAKAVLGVESATFSDARALYVGLALALYGDTSATDKRMSEWARRCMPSSSLPSSAKFLAKCSAAHAYALRQQPSQAPPVTGEMAVTEGEAGTATVPAGDSHCAQGGPAEVWG